MRRGYGSPVVVFGLFLCSAVTPHLLAQSSGADLLAELRSGDSTRCMNASNATSEYQEHYQTLAAELAAPLVAIVESGEGCVDNAISALLNLGSGIAEGVPADRAVPAIVKIVERGLEPTASYEQISTAGSAVIVIGHFGAKGGAAVPVLQRWATTASDYHYRSYGVDALGRLGDVAAPAVPVLLSLAEPSSEDDEHAWEKGELRAQVLRTFGYIPAAVDQTGPILAAALSGHDTSSYIAGESLIMIGRPAVRYLVAALAEEDPEVRVRVLAVVSQIGPEAAEAAPTIAGIIAQGDWNVIYSADEAMRQIGPAPEAVAALTRVLEKQDNEDGVLAASEILGGYGSAARAALPALRKLAASKSWAVANAAKEAISAIEH
jgi:HEAT repeat protein